MSEFRIVDGELCAEDVPLAEVATRFGTPCFVYSRAAIGAALDVAQDDADADVDWNLNDGILEIECAGGSKVIVNRHLPNREIWVAAKAGGFHFAWRDGGWRDTRSGAELAVVLAAQLRAQAGIDIAL